MQQNNILTILLNLLTLIATSDSYIIVPPSTHGMLSASDRNLLLKLKRSLFENQASKISNQQLLSSCFFDAVGEKMQLDAEKRRWVQFWLLLIV